MSEAVLNAFAQQYLDLTLCKSRDDVIDIQWYTEGPFWRRTSMRFSRDYKILPDYEIGDMKHGKTLEDIAQESGNAIENLRAYKKTARPDEKNRVNYLIDHMTHVNTRARMLLGETMPFDTMTQKLYSLVAPAYDYGRFDRILDEMGQALPGSGSAQEKIWAFRDKLTIPRDRVLAVLTAVTQAFHDMSMQRMTLTGNSMPRVRVRDYPDAGMAFLSILFGYDYNHLEYERNFNINFHWTADNVIECIGHEMEPGHLTFYEKRIQAYIDTCWPEMAVVSQYSSSSAFTEGSGRYVIPMCFDLSTGKMTDFEREMVFKTAGLDTGLAELMPLWHRYCEIAGYGKLEVSRHLWDHNWTAAEATSFLKKYAILGKDADDDASTRLAADDGHFVAHDYARDVVKDYFNHVAKTVDDQWRLYEALCSGHMVMGEMADKTFTIDF